ncbi:hypothetical protein GVAV_001567 [Gurleya vavrai]
MNKKFQYISIFSIILIVADIIVCGIYFYKGHRINILPKKDLAYFLKKNEKEIEESVINKNEIKMKIADTENNGNLVLWKNKSKSDGILFFKKGDFLLIHCHEADYTNLIRYDEYLKMAEKFNSDVKSEMIRFLGFLSAKDCKSGNFGKIIANEQYIYFIYEDGEITNFVYDKKKFFDAVLTKENDKSKEKDDEAKKEDELKKKEAEPKKKEDEAKKEDDLKKKEDEAKKN